MCCQHSTGKGENQPQGHCTCDTVYGLIYVNFACRMSSLQPLRLSGGQNSHRRRVGVHACRIGHGCSHWLPWGPQCPASSSGRLAFSGPEAEGAPLIATLLSAAPYQRAWLYDGTHFNGSLAHP